MQILILGNGFDIEHGLPTKYIDFLEFIDDFLEIGESADRDIAIDEVSDDRKKKFFKEMFSTTDNKLIEQLLLKVKNNIWIKYFKRNEEYIKENWIDFEKEISNIIKLLEKAKSEYELEAIFYNDEIKASEAYIKYQKEIYSWHRSGEFYISESTFSFQKNKLLEDLNMLINALEIYLAEYVGKLPVNKYNPDIAALRPTHVLSFNYTDTYYRIYDTGGRNIEYDFIHGRAKENNDSPEMVLGIDEYLSDEERSKNVEFIEFQKYYQRMQKRTSCYYKDWDEKILQASKNGKDKKVELYIFGHSLDVTDKDILREFLLNDNVKTTIFIYNQKAYERGLANLVKVLGTETLLKKMYGKNRTIKFVQQSPSKETYNSEFDIMNDTLKIYRLEQYSNKEINRILEKVKEKILKKEKGYFCSQERIISLFDALDRWNLCTDSETETLLEIAKEMADGKVYHNSGKWNDYDYRGDNGCPVETLNFLEAINSFNAKLAQNPISNFDTLTEFDIVDLYKKNDKLSDDIYKKILEKLLPLIGKKDLNSQYFWKSLCNISYNNMQVAKTVIKRKIELDIDDITRIRLIHLYECCEETEYYWEMERQYRENDNF